MSTVTLTPEVGQTIKYFTCQDCGGRFKANTALMVTKPKYCSYCNKSKSKN